MLSRVAEHMYWMARYLERAENTARLINATSQVVLDLPRRASFGWDVLTQVIGLDDLYDETHPAADEPGIMDFLIADARNPSSILSCMRMARENCRTLREVLPRAAWERINGLYLSVRAGAPGAASRHDRQRALEDVIERLQAVSGLLAECMSHDQGYQFLEMGAHLERADMTTRIVDIHAAVLVPRQQGPDAGSEDPALALLWVGVLKSLSAFQMYRRHGDVQVRADGVVNFLIRDAHFPRSVRYCLDTIGRCLGALPRNTLPLAVVQTACERVDGLQLDQLSPAQRHETMDAIQADFGRIHDAVSASYFHLDYAATVATATA